MYVGRCELQLPTSGTRDLRGHLLSFVRCPRLEADLGAAANGFILNLGQSV
jgi:hypothetical protein